MRLRHFACVTALALFAGFPALADFKPLAEVPPKTFKGQQYVDSRGCVFMRAGHGTQVNWVARMTSNRKQMCGAKPSLDPVKVAAAAPAPKPSAEESKPRKSQAKPEPRATNLSPKPQPQAKEAPAAAQVAVAKSQGKSRTAPPPAPQSAAAPPPRKQTPTPQASPPKAPAPKAPAKKAAAVGDGSGFLCPPAHPVLQQLQMQNGERIYLCSTEAGNISQAVAPVEARGTSGQRKPAAGGQAQVVAAFPDPPKGYRRAWSDDRLNPYRGMTMP